jgi:hypothetical protein
MPYRFEIPVIRSKKRRSLAIDPATGQPWQVWFVNNTSHSEGTFESPFPTLVQAQNASAPNDMIYVFPGDGTSTGMNAGIVLQDQQKLFGSAISQTIPTALGTVVILAQSSPRPLLTNLGGTGIVVQLANGNEVSGLNIQHGAAVPGGAGLVGVATATTTINGGSVHDNIISTNGGASQVGIFINGIGTFFIQNNTLLDSGATTFGIQMFVGASLPNSMTAFITNNTTVGYATVMQVVPPVLSPNFLCSLTIANNNMINSSNAGINIQGGGELEFDANILNNTITNAGNFGILLTSNVNSCIEILGNSISAGVSGIFLMNASGNTSLNSTLSNNQISSGNVVVENSVSDAFHCLEMVNNNVPGGYDLINAVGSTFNLGPLVNNIGPITETDTITPIGECPTCGGLSPK